MPTWTTPYWRQITDESRDLDPAFAKHLRDIARPTQIAYSRLMRHSQGNPIGVEMKRPGADFWCVVLPEPVPEGGKPRWRELTFTPDGFNSHHGFNTVDDAVISMINSGFATIDHGALERLSQTARWHTGQLHQDLRDRHIRGELTFREMNEAMAAA